MRVIIITRLYFFLCLLVDATLVETIFFVVTEGFLDPVLSLSCVEGGVFGLLRLPCSYKGSEKLDELIALLVRDLDNPEGLSHVIRLLSGKSGDGV